MATGTFSETNGNGVTYLLTYTPATVVPPAAAYYTLTITDPGGGVTTVDNIPPSNVLAANSTGTLGSLISVGTNVYVIPPTATGTVDITAGLSNNTTVYVGGTATIDQTAAVGGTTTVNVDGGTATLANGIVASALAGTTINLENGGTFGNGSGLLAALNSGTVTFGTGGGTFDANASGTGGIALLSSTTINGFDTNTDDITFNSLADPVASYNVSASSGGSQTITFYSGTSGTGTTLASFTVTNSTNFSSGTYSVGSGPLDFVTNSAGDTTITVCFCAGTAIATPEGEVAVETLKEGDLVLTADGRSLPIRWMGQSHVARAFADPIRSYPIRITAGALGENLPKRDLRVSSEHGIFISGVLVQAAALVNNETVLQETRIPHRLTYYHVELATHELLLTEGVPTESFVDNVDRMNFHNWETRTAPDEAIAEMPYPRAKSARRVPPRIRAELLSRASGRTAA